MRNVIIQFEMGENVLIYAHDELSNDVRVQLQKGCKVSLH